MAFQKLTTTHRLQKLVIIWAYKEPANVLQNMKRNTSALFSDCINITPALVHMNLFRMMMKAGCFRLSKSVSDFLQDGTEESVFIMRVNLKKYLNGWGVGK